MSVNERSQGSPVGIPHLPRALRAVTVSVTLGALVWSPLVAAASPALAASPAAEGVDATTPADEAAILPVIPVAAPATPAPATPAENPGQVRPSFGVDGARVRAVPYGVNLAAWLNAQDDLYLDGSLPGSSPHMSAVDVAWRYFFARGPLALAPTLAAYPVATPGVTPSSCLAWESPTTASLPDLSGLDAVVALPAPPASAADVAAAPPQVLGMLRVIRPDGSLHEPVVTGSLEDGNLKLWLCGRDQEGGSARLTPQWAPGVADQLSSSYALESDGSLVAAAPADGLPVAGATSCFVKIGHVPDPVGDVTYWEGQLLRVDLASDRLAPELDRATATLTKADGGALTAPSAPGPLVVGAQGVILTVPVREAAPTLPGDVASGLDVSKVRLDLAGRSLEPRSVTNDGKAVFVLSADTIGTGETRLDTARIRVSDVAGNESSAPVSELAAVSALKATTLRVMDDSRPTCTLAAKDRRGRTVADGGATELEPVLTRLVIHDPNLSELRKDGTWRASGSLRVTVDGVESVVDPARLRRVAGDGDSFYLDLDRLRTEGKHTVSVSYVGASVLHANLRPQSAQANLSFTIDLHPPVASGLRVEGGVDATSVAAVPDVGKVLVGGERRLYVTVTDETVGGPSPSGVKSVRATLVRHDRPGDAGMPVDLGRLPRRKGEFELVLSSPGRYDLKDVVLTLEDWAGNRSTVPLSAVSAQHGGPLDLAAVLVDARRRASLVVLPGEAGPVLNDQFYPADSLVALDVADPWLGYVALMPSFPATFTGTHVTASGTSDLAPSVLSLSPRQVAPDVLRLDLGLPRTDGRLADGWYRIDCSCLPDVWGGVPTLSFGVDTMAPQLTAATVARDGSVVATLPDGRSVLVGGTRRIRVRVQDLLPRPAGADVAGVDVASEDYSSGLDAGSVTVSLTRQAGMGAQAARSEKTRSLAVDGEGWATIDLEGEGLYRLDDIKVSARDRYGNRLASRTLADYRDALPEQERSTWGFDSILVDLGSAASVRTRLEDDEATPPSAKPYYHRGEVRERVLVTDPWFPVYASLASGAPLVTGTLSVPGASVPETLSLSVLPRDFTPVEGAENVWESVVSLPRADGGKLPREGDYTLRCEYGGVRSKVLGDDPHTDEQSFGVDYTAPDLGSLTFSQTSPFPVRESGDKRGTPWGWVFSPDGEQVTLAVTDRLSGVVGEGLSLASHPTGNVALTFEPDAAGGLSHESDPLAGVASFSLSQDGQRVVLAGSAITAVDTAGNAATVDLAALGSNLPADAMGVAVDIEAPVVSVSYDNDDVRNGRYFNARRTATVTVQDASFDLTREFAPETVVASGFKDGSQHAGRTLVAKDFEPITQEDGTVVYVATLPFDEDGDWRLSAGYTDPAGHASNTTNDEFTIDTEAPKLQVNFDNNDVSNAMYYKAPRTATITVDDRNFAPQLGSIDASALQAGPGPSVGAWSETRPRATWVATASFAGETHYRLKVVVSDLAGNVSEAYDSQEFVIDLTAPEVAITGVQDHHAYGGEAAAGATFKDTNLDAQLSDYTLASVRDEYAFWPGKQESATATEKVVSLGDVPYESPRDDVYTLKATAVDLAGNHAETQATYSVNRFGSTYFFADGSKGVPGAFMAAPQEVDVVEVNVSGLDTSGSRVRLSQDDRARTLSPDVDYNLEANAPDAGWSSTTYRLPARLFSTDGFYRVTLTSTDAAGNLSQNTMDGKGEGREGTFPIEFAVDQTVPTSELGGVQAGAVYLDPAKEALVGSGDNLGVASVEVLRDGERLDGWEGADVQGATPTVRLLADGAAHDYRVEVRDKAGNVSASDYRGVVVTGDLLTYITRTPRLLALVVAAVVVLVGALSGGSMLAVRFRRMGERWRNPFGH